jgi:tetratricopeptide (TPR) repeat protein
MLFDLRGRRKRLIQVIYVFLALLLGGSLVFFGIGGDAPGGLGNAIGLDPNSGGTGNDTLDSEIDDAEAALETNPQNQTALLRLARAQAQAAGSALEQQDDGQVAFTDEAVSRYEQAANAWERYLAVTKGKPKNAEEAASVGAQVARGYEALAFATDDPVLIQRRLDASVTTLELVTSENPNPNSLFQLAAFAYLAGDTKVAERAREQALGAVDKASRSSLETQLDSVKRQGRSVQKQLKAAEKQGSGTLESPLGSLDSGADGSTPSGG